MSFILCLMEASLMFWMMFSIFPCKYRKTTRYKSIIAVMIVVQTCIFSYFSSLSLIERDSIYILSVLIVMQLLFEGKWFIKLYFILLCMYVYLVTDIVLMNAFTGITGCDIPTILNSNYYIVFAVTAKITNIMLVYMLIRFFSSIKLEIEGKYWTIMNFLTGFFLVFLQCFMLINDMLNKIGIREGQILAFWSTYLLVCTCVIYLFGELCKFYQKEQEKLFAEMKAVALEEEIAIQLDFEETVQYLRHDMKNHMQNIMYLVKEKRTTELVNYIEDIDLEIERIDPKKYTNNPIVDIILNRKMKECYHKGIEMVVKTDVLGKLPMTEMDMSSILTNLLDNAIEANEHIQKNKQIDVQMYHFKGYYVIKIKNSYDGLLVQHNGTMLTRKNDKLSHGYGIHIIKKLVQRYDGEVEFYQDKKTFMVAVMLPYESTLKKLTS